MSIINESLLDALLSRLSSGDRYNAEYLYQAVPLDQRVPAFMALLFHIYRCQPMDEGRFLLAAILLRRDISKLGAVARRMEDSKSNVVTLLQNYVDSTMQLIYLVHQHNLQLQLVYLLAEFCSSLDFIDESIGKWTIQKLLDNLMGSTAKNLISPKVTLRFISVIAQQCPISMWQGVEMDFMNNFFRSLVVSWIDDTNLTNDLMINLDSLFEAVTFTCIASDIASIFKKRTMDTDDVQEVFVQRIFLQTELSQTSYRPWVDEHAISARLGKALLPHMFTLLAKCGKDGTVIKKCMGHMVHCADVSPSTFTSDVHHLSRILECSCILLNEQDTATCLAVLDFIGSLLDINHVQQTLMEHQELRKHCIFGGNNYPGLLKICADTIVLGLDYDDIEGWGDCISPVYEEEYWDGDEIAYHGQTLLESFLRNFQMDANMLTNFLKSLEASLFNRESHPHQEAALCIFHACTVAVPDLFKPHFPTALEFAIFHATLPIVRLQFQCAYFIASACESQLLMVEWPMENYLKIMHCLKNLLCCKCDKVVAKTCFAFVSFFRNIYANHGQDESILFPILHEVVSAIIMGPLCDEGNTIILTHAISAVAALAGISSGKFAPFYDQIMPGLLSCASINPVHEHMKVDASVTSASALRSAAIEAASIIILSVSLEYRDVRRLEIDAGRIMDIILIMLMPRCEHEDEDKLLISSSRVARVLEDKFMVYLPSIVQYATSVLSEDVSVSVTDGNDTEKGINQVDEESGLESMTILVPGLGNKKISLNTCQIEGKIMVTNALKYHADALGPHFGTFALEAIHTLHPLIHFQYSAQLRVAVAGTLAAIFTTLCEYSCAMESKKCWADVSAVLDETSVHLAEQLDLENDEDFHTMSALAESISEICYSAYSYFKEGHTEAIMNETAARAVVKLFLRTIHKCLYYRKMTTAIMSEKNDEILSGESLMTSSVDSIGYILKSYGPRFLSIFDESIHPFFSQFMKATVSADILARHAAVCLYDDCVEHCGHVGASTYSPHLLEAALLGIDDNRNEGNHLLKQASIYGIIQLSRFSPNSLLSCNASELLNIILDVALIGVDKKKEDIENLRLVENAASALASLYLCSGSPFNSLSSFDKSSCLDAFLHNLPLQEDEDEAKICHKIFVDMLTEDVIINRVDLIVQIAGKLGSLLESNQGDLVTEETLNELSRILKHMKTRLDPQLMNRSVQNLSPDEYKGFISIMTNY